MIMAPGEMATVEIGPELFEGRENLSKITVRLEVK